ncbi:putative acyl-CoA synthetase family member 4-like [Apostichopus japonicus]|uniref:Putative acyl-CoA synthetase family member 4-like n=1 Tax=Stichopus japonicus TaxID=307972 RepID=A0A2G8LLE3_STIJA|nr:putative acyl-CoA synthetase family member 4-like [Apostichopus japonicus]
MGENVSMVTQEMTDGAQLSMKENWSLDLEKCIDASPLVVIREGSPDIIVYIGSHSGIFLGLDLETGRRLWQVRLPDRIESSACFSPSCNLVVVGCYDHHIYFLDAMTGTVYWMFRTLGPVKSSPTSDPVTGLVYVGSHDSNVYALQPQTKTCQWSMSDGGGSMFSSPCIDSWNNSLYTASLSGKLLSISEDAGDVKWYYQCPKPLFSSPVVAVASVVIGCVDGSIYIINHLGKLLHRIPTEAPVFSSPCLVTLDNREIILVGSHDGHVYGINLHEGTTSWKTKIGKHVYSSPSCIFNNIYTLFNSEIGNRSEMESGKESSQALSRVAGNGLVCCCSTTGTLVILDLNSGKELTSHLLPGEIFSSPLLMEDGRIILGCRNNMIYSFSLDTG